MRCVTDGFGGFGGFGEDSILTSARQVLRTVSIALIGSRLKRYAYHNLLCGAHLQLVSDRKEVNRIVSPLANLQSSPMPVRFVSAFHAV